MIKPVDDFKQKDEYPVVEFKFNKSEPDSNVVNVLGKVDGKEFRVAQFELQKSLSSLGEYHIRIWPGNNMVSNIVVNFNGETRLLK